MTDYLSSIERETLIAIYELLQRQIKSGIATPNPPTIRQIMAELGKNSTSVVNYRLMLLCKKGLTASNDYPGGTTSRLTDDGLLVASQLWNTHNQEKIRESW